jgi:D-alanyl-D-alanine carboxypeptidase
MFAPGSDYYYSNTNYVLLGLIIEQLDGRPVAEAFEARLFEPLGMTDTFFPPATSHEIPEPSSRGYLYGTADHVMMGTAYTPEMAAEAEAGTLQPTDFTDINHSFSFTAGAVISTAADLATWIDALASGKVLDAEYQRLWQDSAKVIDPANSFNWYGYGIDQLRWGPNTIDLHGGQTPGFNSEALHDPANDMTLVIWANLTMSVEGKFTAADLMVKVLDQIYALSPLALPVTAVPTTTPS